MLPFVLALTVAASPPLNPVSPRLMSVSADAKVTFFPNQVVATFQVITRERDAATARKLNEEKLRKLLAALKAVGVEQRALLLHENGVAPEYRGNETIAHFATRTVVITISDLQRVDEILTTALKHGGQVYGSTQLRNTEVRAWDSKARVAAATAARERATALVEAVGGKLGLPRAVTEQTSNNQGFASVNFAAGPDGQVTTSFSSYELTITAQVTVQFDIRDES